MDIAKYKNSKPGSLDWWIYLVASSVRNADEKAIREIAGIAKEKGCGVWHALYLYQGKKHQCYCAKCFDMSTNKPIVQSA